MATAKVRQRGGVSSAEPHYAGGAMVYMKSEKIAEKQVLLVGPLRPQICLKKHQDSNPLKAVEWRIFRGIDELKLLW